MSVWSWTSRRGFLRRALAGLGALAGGVWLGTAGRRARAGLGRLWIDMNRWGRLATVLEGGSHHMGTTRMSASAKDGVVDERCRLHECPELYIAGSSVFPSVGFANPTLTLVALAHRMAEDLRRELA